MKTSDARRPARGPVAEHRGQLRLQIQAEEVPAAAGGEVRLVPHAPEEREGAPQAHVLVLRHQLRVAEPGQSLDAEDGVGDPEDGVQVAQPARALLQVGLDDPDRVPEPLPCLSATSARTASRKATVARRLERRSDLEAAEQRAGRGARGRPPAARRRGPCASAGPRAPAVTHSRGDRKLCPTVRPDVPEALQHVLDEGAQRVRGAAGMEEQEIDVRGRRQLAAAVTSQGHDRALRELLACAGGRVFRGRAADAQQQRVHHVAACGRDLEPVQPESLAHAKALAFQAQEAAIAFLRVGGAVLAGGIDCLRGHDAGSH